ncbi:hypothetical protein D9756_010384 [Leucocoprinus leucothites]|uniref:Uncharacterized protein n=1 Tax=Leucocoprinus leucothites TaxID=201217 RepID=A0A8H5CRV9_9AGAR|nr:hypothetical protein D9756_010384 [Leucoagaricus leucothites]
MRLLQVFAIPLIALATPSTAQYADSCLNALSGLINGNGQATQCFDPSDLIDAVIHNTTSVVVPLNQWAISTCDAPPCSNQTLATIVDTVLRGCLSKFIPLAQAESPNSLDLPGLISQSTSWLQQYYPTIRKAVCLLDTSFVMCLTQMIESIQTVEGTITLDDLLSTLETGFDVSSFPVNVTCTDCNKAIYNVLKQGIPSLSPDITTGLAKTCGASFINGASSSGVSSAAIEDTNRPGSNGTGGPSEGFGQNASGVITMSVGFGAAALTLIISAVATVLL